MTENGHSGAGTTIAEIEARRTERKNAIEAARTEQYARDLIQVDRLEEEHGPDRVAVLNMPSFKAGLPTLVVVATPSEAVFKRFRDQVRNANQSGQKIGQAKDMMAASCVLYPEKEIYDQMRQNWPPLHDGVGVEAIRLGEALGKD